MNVQYAIQKRHGLRARSEPARLAHRAVRLEGDRRAAGQDRGALHGGQDACSEQSVERSRCRRYFSVKEAVFPFASFPGVDTILGPEMKSTGEVMGVGETFGEAFVKSQLAAGVQLPKGGHAFISVRDGDKLAAVHVARDLAELGFRCSRRAAPPRCSSRTASRVTGQQGRRGPPAHRRHDQERRRQLHRQHRGGDAHRESATRARSAPPRWRGASPTTPRSPARKRGLRWHEAPGASSSPTGCRICTPSLRQPSAGTGPFMKTPMTRRGAELLREELHRLKTIERPANSAGDRRGARARRPLGERRVPCRARARRLHRRAHLRARGQARQRAGDRPEAGRCRRPLRVRRHRRPRGRAPARSRPGRSSARTRPTSRTAASRSARPSRAR